MRKRTRTSMAAALGLFALVGLVAVLATSIAWPNLARAQVAASLTALTVTPGTLAGVQQHRDFLHGRPDPRRDPDHHRDNAHRRRQLAFAKPGLFGTADPGRRYQYRRPSGGHHAPFQGFIYAGHTQIDAEASLTALTVSPDPAFSSTETSYTVALTHDVADFQITIVPSGGQRPPAPAAWPLRSLRNSGRRRSRTPISLPTAIRWTSWGPALSSWW